MQRVPPGFWDRLAPLLQGNQADLARRLKVSQPAVGRWKNHERIPDLLSLVAICRVFNVSADWLLGLEEEGEREHVALLSVAEPATAYNAGAARIEERLRHIEEQLVKLTGGS